MSGYRLTLALVLTSALAATLCARLNPGQDSASAQIVEKAPVLTAVAAGCPSGSCDG